jgi:hypothetical protein
MSSLLRPRAKSESKTVLTESKRERTVAVVVPVYRSIRTPEEEISYRQLLRVLDRHEKYLIGPESLPLNPPEFRVKRFGDEYFTSVAAYSRLLLSREFYETFVEYQYILIYQLDCLVFSDRLAHWCQAGFDYIGAPWLKFPKDPAQGFSRVGNGGLSLRRVNAFLRVIDSCRLEESDLWSYWRDVCFTPLPDLQNQDYSWRKRWKKRRRIFSQVRRGARWYRANFPLNEDRFWSDRAKLFDPAFRIAPVEVGLRFSFEQAPRYCFERTNQQLPFGCHAWHKYDREFWTSFL